MVNGFKQTLHLSVVACKDHDVVSIGEIRHMDDGSNLNPWVILLSFANNPVDNVLEEGRVENASSSNAGSNLPPPFAPTFFVDRGIVRLYELQSFRGHSV